MAILKIQYDIAQDETASEMRLMGFGAVTYNDVDDFVGNIPEDDGAIEVRLHCNGGSVSEGWAIYDKLRASGKEITAVVDGKAASMATVIMMAAPKERRYAYENATILVHNPYVWGTYDHLTADNLQRMADNLHAEQERMLDLYVERCGCQREEMQRLMDESMPLTAAKALEVGLIGTIMPYASAKADDDSSINHKNKCEKAMEEERKEVKASLVDKLLAKFGLKDLDEVEDAIDSLDVESKEGEEVVEPVAMELNTAEGGVLTIERENGEPQIGDKAQPDGEHEMPDGRVIVVENGVITDIKTPEEEVTEEQEQEEDETEALRKEVEELRAELEEARKMAKSKDDLRILNAVKMAGGEQALKCFASSYVPEVRKRDGKEAKDKAESIGEPSPMRLEIEARKKGEFKRK